jgi:hypothetical protein
MKTIDRRTTAEKRKSRKGRKAYKDGHGFEDQVVDFLRKNLPERFWIRRNEPGDVLINCNDDPFIFGQCKQQPRPNIRAALRQAHRDNKGTAAPAAITEAEGEETILSVSLKDFVWLILNGAAETTEEK